MRILLSLAILSSFISCTSFFNCVEGVGEITSWDTVGSPIHSIDNNLSADIKYNYDPRLKETRVSIEGEQNLLDMIELEFDGAELEIDASQCLNSKEGIKIIISSPNLRSLKMDGSGNFKCEQLISTKKLHMELNGSGNIDISAETKELEAILYGSGDIKLSGKSKYLESKIIGSGDIDAEFLEAQEVYSKINGSGNSRVWATQDLEIKISGSGDVFYKGDPSELSQKTKGSGTVEKL